MSLKAAGLCMLMLLSLAGAAQAVKFGEDGTGDTDYNNLTSARIRATQWVCPASGNINTISLYVSALGTGGNAQVAVYGDGGTDTPGALLAQGSDQTLATGWNDFPFTEIPVTAGATYWLVFEGTNRPTFRTFADANPNRTLRCNVMAYGDFPDPYPSTMSPQYGNFRICMYAWDTNDVTPTSTPTNTPTFTITPTLTITSTFTIAPTSSDTPTFTVTPTFTATPSITPTFTITRTFTITPTFTVTPPYTPSFTPTFTRTSTITMTPTISETPTISPTLTASPTRSPSPTITLTSTPRLSSPDLSRVFVHPNPWIESDVNGHFRTVFENLTASATIRIYTINGKKIRELPPGASGDGGHTNNYGNGRAEWALTNENGAHVASGIYIYIISDKSGNSTTGRLAVIH